MAASYLFAICQNHPFVDGNKRTGANAAVTFLYLNDWDMALDPDELVEIVLAVATGETGKEELVNTFESRCRTIRLPD